MYCENSFYNNIHGFLNKNEDETKACVNIYCIVLKACTTDLTDN